MRRRATCGKWTEYNVLNAENIQFRRGVDKSQGIDWSSGSREGQPSRTRFVDQLLTHPGAWWRQQDKPWKPSRRSRKTSM